MKKIIRIGSRPSDLALEQVRLVISQLQQRYPESSFIIVPLKTTGDIRRDTLNLNVKDKKEWVIELEEKIITGDIDFAVHSAKDVPLQIEQHTALRSVLPRADFSDVLLYNRQGELPCEGNPLPMLHPGATVGTSSKRRRSQLLRLRPDLCVTVCRGNVPTRVSKLRDQKLYDGIILARAGLERLDLHNHPLSYVFPMEEMLPAVAQGTLVAQFHSSNVEVEAMLDSIVDEKTEISFKAERAFVNVLGADCHSSVGVCARIFKDQITIMGRVLSDDGFECIEDVIEGNLDKAEKLGEELGKNMLSIGACAIL